MSQENYVAKTILEQIELGFNMHMNLNGTDFKLRFVQYTGAKEFLYSDNSLRFKISGAKFKGKILITLTVDDLYNVEFWKIVHKRNKFMYHGKELTSTYPEQKLVKEFKGIDNSNLTGLILRETGIN